MHRTCADLCHAERGDQGDYRQKLRTIRKSEYGSSTADVKQAAHTVLNVSDGPIANGMKLAGRPSVMLRTYESTTGRYRAARVAVRTRRIHPLAAANDRAHPPNE